MKAVPSDNIVSNASLRTRLDLNQRYSRFDFHQWVFDRYGFAPGMDVLDVGCGNGAQAMRALEIVGRNGSVSALDLSRESIDELKSKAQGYPNLEAHVADMADLEPLLRTRLRIKTYDLAHSTYALGYALQPIPVLDAMRRALKAGGRLIVTTPIDPNSLRELAKRYGQPVPRLDQIGRMPGSVLEPYFRAYFARVTIHLQRNVLRIPRPDDVIEFFRSTAYYDASLEPIIRAHAAVDIESRGFFGFEKNNFMIVGENLAEAD